MVNISWETRNMDLVSIGGALSGYSAIA